MWVSKYFSNIYNTESKVSAAKLGIKLFQYGSSISNISYKKLKLLLSCKLMTGIEKLAGQRDYTTIEYIQL